MYVDCVIGYINSYIYEYFNDYSRLNIAHSAILQLKCPKNIITKSSP